ncbi:DeoR/GlpR family DNA-binding transcription regulator [Leifsonia sp. NPDC056665]|uniref:DeoR/GlpR family DNA-binding transcription regulator n=1 Tax=Leifsonia sp. NPDC056665 TaxID=3345901 RepID=UPI00367F142E
MLASERHARILDMLRAARTVRTEEIAEALSVSMETARRDLVALDRRGVLKRVHGGARNISLVPVGDEPPFLERANTAGAAKQAIGARAAGLIVPGQTIIIDVGTTALQAARAIPLDYNGVVATCSLLAAVELADRPNLEVLVAGGRVRAGDLALSNAQTVDFFREIHADVAFLGSGGVDAAAGLTDFYLDEAMTRRVILKNSTANFVLADSSKFGRVARHHVADLEQIDGLISDKPLPERILAAMRPEARDLSVA